MAGSSVEPARPRRRAGKSRRAISFFLWTGRIVIDMACLSFSMRCLGLTGMQLPDIGIINFLVYEAAVPPVASFFCNE